MYSLRSVLTSWLKNVPSVNTTIKSVRGKPLEQPSPPPPSPPSLLYEIFHITPYLELTATLASRWMTHVYQYLKTDSYWCYWWDIHHQLQIKYCQAVVTDRSEQGYLGYIFVVGRDLIYRTKFPCASKIWHDIDATPTRTTEERIESEMHFHKDFLNQFGEIWWCAT